MLRPKSVDLYLVYECPTRNCGALFTILREETIFPGGIRCQSCGANIKLEPIESIRVIPNYKKSTKSVENKTNKNYNDIVLALVKYGYNKATLVKRVKELAHLPEAEIIQIIMKEKP